KLDFGAGGGRDELRTLLAADDGAHWQMLGEVFDLGCAASDETSLTLPWYFAQTIPVDPYMGAIVTGEGVPLRSEPASNADAPVTLSWQAVEQLPSDTDDEEFAFVRWTNPDGGQVTEGYIARDRLRSMIDYRLIANRRNDRWRITALVSGD
ncbi:MAG: hypothetical protein WA957_02055, partial [Alteraurantiacibacter sp.]